MSERIPFNPATAAEQLRSGVSPAQVFERALKGKPLPRITLDDLSSILVDDGPSRGAKKLIVNTLVRAAGQDMAETVRQTPVPIESPVSFTLRDSVTPELLRGVLVPQFEETTRQALQYSAIEFVYGLGSPHFDPVFRSLDLAIPIGETREVLANKLIAGGRTLIRNGAGYQPLLSKVYQAEEGEAPRVGCLLGLALSSTGIFMFPASRNVKFFNGFSTYFGVTKTDNDTDPRFYNANLFALSKNGGEFKVVAKSDQKIILLKKWLADSEKPGLRKVLGKFWPQLKDPIYFTGCPVRFGSVDSEGKKQLSLIDTVVHRYVTDIRAHAA